MHLLRIRSWAKQIRCMWCEKPRNSGYMTWLLAVWDVLRTMMGKSRLRMVDGGSPLSMWKVKNICIFAFLLKLDTMSQLHSYTQRNCLRKTCVLTKIFTGFCLFVLFLRFHLTWFFFSYLAFVTTISNLAPALPNARVDYVHVTWPTHIWLKCENLFTTHS